PASGTPCDTKAVYYSTTGGPVTANMASEREGGNATVDRALAVWATDTFNLRAQRLESVGTGGAVSVVSAACGNGGTIGVNGPAAIANTDFAITLSGAQGVLAVLNWNAPSAPIPLGSCLVTPLGLTIVTTLVGGAS